MPLEDLCPATGSDYSISPSCGCLLCIRGPPACMSHDRASWVTIVHVTFFALHHKQPEKQCFSLKTAVYPYVIMHWKALGLAEKNTNNWQKLIIDTLSHSPHLFVTGAHLVAKYASPSITLHQSALCSAVNANASAQSAFTKDNITIYLLLLRRSGYWALKDTADPWTLSTPRNKTRRARVARYVAAATMQLPASPSSPTRVDITQASQLGPIRNKLSPVNKCSLSSGMLVRAEEKKEREEEGEGKDDTREQFQLFTKFFAK